MLLAKHFFLLKTYLGWYVLTKICWSCHKNVIDFVKRSDFFQINLEKKNRPEGEKWIPFPDSAVPKSRQHSKSKKLLPSVINNIHTSVHVSSSNYLHVPTHECQLKSSWLTKILSWNHFHGSFFNIVLLVIHTLLSSVWQWVLVTANMTSPHETFRAF